MSRSCAARVDIRRLASDVFTRMLATIRSKFWRKRRSMILLVMSNVATILALITPHTRISCRPIAVIIDFVSRAQRHRAMNGGLLALRFSISDADAADGAMPSCAATPGANASDFSQGITVLYGICRHDDGELRRT